MRLRLLTALTLLTFCATGQTTSKITIWNNYAKWVSYHTVGRSEGKITFNKNEKGEFVATRYYIGKRKKKLKNPIIIENNRVKNFEDGLSSNKKVFKIGEIDIDSTVLFNRIKQSNELNFPVSNPTVRIDSFKFCNQHYRRPLYLIGKQDLQEEFSFFDSLGNKIIQIDTFHLANRILLHNLLKDRLPEEFPIVYLFNDDLMIHYILDYLKTTECEDYYYKEYLKKNPDKSAKEKRMRIGWNFKEYMMKEKGLKAKD